MDTITKAIRSLLNNDKEEVYEERKKPVKPRKVIEELIDLNKAAVFPALLQLIERYENEKEGRYYIEYVIEILGRVGGVRSARALLRILHASVKAGIDNDDSVILCIRWLRTLGRTAVPPLIMFVDENYHDQNMVMVAGEVVEEVRDKRLGPLLLRLLRYPNPVVIQSALISLKKQDKKSAVPYIVPLLRYQDTNPAEQRETREYAWRALESLLRDDRTALRAIKSGTS